MNCPFYEGNFPTSVLPHCTSAPLPLALSIFLFHHTVPDTWTALCLLLFFSSINRKTITKRFFYFPQNRSGCLVACDSDRPLLNSAVWLQLQVSTRTHTLGIASMIKRFLSQHPLKITIFSQTYLLKHIERKLGTFTDLLVYYLARPRPCGVFFIFPHFLVSFPTCVQRQQFFLGALSVW